MLFSIIAFGLILASQTVPVSSKSNPGTILQGHIRGKTNWLYQVSLAAGEFAELELEQQGIDLRVTVTDPVQNTFHVDARENGPEDIFISAEHPGIYRLEVQPLQGTLQAAPYRLAVKQVRPGDPDDASRLAAQQLSSQAKQLVAEGPRLKIQQALQKSSEAVDIWHRLGDPQREAVALGQLGALRYLLSEFEVAKQCFLRSLRLAGDAPEPWLEGEDLNDLGLIFWQLGEFTVSTEHLTRALEIWRKLKHPYGEAATLSNLGILHREIGAYEKSRGYYRQALRIISSLHDRAHEAYVWNNMGVVSHALAEDGQALHSFWRSIRLFRAARSYSAEGRALLHIARIYLDRTNLASARQYAQQAQSLLQTAGDDRSLGDALNLQGELLGTSDRDQALEYHNKALAIFRRLPNPEGEAGALHDIGVLYARFGKPAIGLQYLEDAYSIRHSLHNRDGEANTLFHLASVERDLGRLSEAQSHMELAIELVESLRVLAAGPHARMSYLASKERYFSFLADLYLELDRQHSGEDFASRAFNTIERGRARSLLDLLGETRMGRLRSVRPDLVNRESKLRESLDFWSVRLTEASARSNQARQKEAAGKVEELLENYHDLEAQIRAADPRYQLLAPQPLSSHDIQQQVLDADTVLLEYALGEKHSNLWVVTARSLSVFHLPLEKTINTQARRLRAQLLNSASKRPPELKDGEELSRVAMSLSRLLLEPVASFITGKRLVIIGSGVLQQVPFAILPDPRSGKPLIEEHEISFLPSASALAAERQVRRTRKPASRLIAAIVDPVFDAGDARVSNPVPGIKPVFPRLPNSRAEADTILKLIPPPEVLRATDFAADRSLFFSGAVEPYKIVHIGTHAMIDVSRPELSALVFSLVDRNGLLRHGYLRLHEIASLRLSADLVTLSGCSTGLGQPVSGEGVVGFARAFASIGVPAVVVSLWNVEDEATARFMSLFYHSMFTYHLGPAAALRQAQISMAKEKRWTPYHWSGWLMIGDWR